MKKVIQSFGGLIILGAIILMANSVYIVDETQQAVITQFGEPIGQPIRKSGLYFKTPFTQSVTYFDKRILNWDGDPNQIPTRDKRFILVDTTARWKIVDPLKFMQSVGGEAGAYSRLDSIIDAATRDSISSLNLVETVRNSNRLMEKANTPVPLDEEMGVTDIEMEKITVGRDKLTREILSRAVKNISTYGIELVDVRIKRITYVQEVLLKVYERMVSERKRAAEQFRSVGQGKKAEIEGQMEKELEEIRSTAYRKAQEIKGIADGKATKIFAEAYNNDPEFYAFLKTLETYRNTVNSGTTLFLSTESEYYRYLKNIGRENKIP